MSTRGGLRSGAGRKARKGSPMPKTAFTALPEEIFFYRLYSGTSNTVSAGVQKAVKKLAELDNEAKENLKQAQWIANKARQELEHEITEQVNNEMIFKYVDTHFERLLQEWFVNH